MIMEIIFNRLTIGIVVHYYKLTVPVKNQYKIMNLYIAACN